ncbi:pyrroline-5-carboxylate reductase [Pararhizobium sp. LjRoot238]|uniref:pyrroline-5-carboxylate reductase n=1 Tax=Pararhizobium sp. LjRoot238 TaxID=3342293 RepID=UPI003ECDAAD1
MKLGFVGAGAITEAMVTGLLTAPPLAGEVVVSPRNAEVAGRLAERFAAVRIARDNQAVVDASDVLVLAIRPQVAQEVVRALRFRQGQTVISVIAATDRGRLLDWIDQDVRLTQAIPLPFVADRNGVTAIYPPDPQAAAIFSGLGTAVECATREEYDLLAVASALMGTYFGILDRTTGWLAEKGIPADKARAYLTPLFASLAETAVRSHASLEDIRREFSTKGGLNEQVFDDFDRNGGSKALADALARVLLRIQS